MRFLVQPAPVPARSRAPVRIFLVFAALAVAAYAVQRLLSGGLSAAEVEAYYLGAPGGDPLPAAALWEELHAGAFVHGFVLFMLGALLALCPLSRRARGALLGAAFVATLADLLAPFVIAAAGGAGALRVATFLAATATLASLLAAVAAGPAAWGEPRA